MKRMKLIYTLLLAVALPLLTACYNDDAINVDEPTKEDGKITVRFRVSQASSNITRAGAEKGELMSVWTVIAVDETNNNVVGIWSCKPNDEKEEDVIEEIVATLDKNKSYRVYSFANIGIGKLGSLLGLGNKIPIPDDDGKIAATTEGLEGCVLTDVDKIAVQIIGNGFNLASTDNNLGAQGIPMSNVQTFESLNDNDKKDLIVIRMMAKIRLEFYNDKGEGKDVKIKSITLTNLTTNDAEKNLMLLPSLTKGQDEPGYIHGDIKPNLYVDESSGEKPAQVNYTVYSYDDEDKKNDVVQRTISGTKSKSTGGTPEVFEFYVNESDTPNRELASPKPKDPNNEENENYNPDFYHFFLEVELEGEEKARYLLIDDRNKDSGDNGKWNYIARNDYRIIPIVLDDYKLDMIPYDFPAIGVYPASVKEEDGIYTINFHDYGHFHLVPQVTRYSDKAELKTYVPYGESSETDTDKTYWTLVEDESEDADKTWKNSWGSWTDASKKYEYENEGKGFDNNLKELYDNVPFYRPGYASATKDADEAGGEPVWYPNPNNVNPTWSADAKYSGPFIFGYIADPGKELTKDRKVYHEFSILLHKAGDSANAKRVMTYRLYMILDTGQMMYPATTSRTSSAPRCSHHWH